MIISGFHIKDLDYFTNGTTSKLEKVELDVTSTDSISSAVSLTQRITDGKLDMLINNAGYGYMMPLLDIDKESVRRNFDVNVFGLLEVTQAFFPFLQNAQGMVVNQASIAGLPNVCQPYIGSYSASKAAVIDLSNTMRVELAPFGIQVVTLITGDVKTEFWNSTVSYNIGLPESSQYLPIQPKVEDMMRGKTNPPGQHMADRWASAVVGDLLRSNPPVYSHRGYLATTMRIVSWILPVWLGDWLFTQSADLDKLKTILGSEASKKDR